MVTKIKKQMKNIKGPKYSLPKKTTDKKFSSLQELIDSVSGLSFFRAIVPELYHIEP
jgi:hypothetical protein